VRCWRSIRRLIFVQMAVKHGVPYGRAVEMSDGGQGESSKSYGAAEGAAMPQTVPLRVALAQLGSLPAPDRYGMAWHGRAGRARRVIGTVLLDSQPDRAMGYDTSRAGGCSVLVQRID
jgi:hypothetical protein